MWEEMVAAHPAGFGTRSKNRRERMDKENKADAA
jgi:hypothetical protein